MTTTNDHKHVAYTVDDMVRVLAGAAVPTYLHEADGDKDRIIALSLAGHPLAAYQAADGCYEHSCADAEPLPGLLLDLKMAAWVIASIRYAARAAGWDRDKFRDAVSRYALEIRQKAAEGRYGAPPAPTTVKIQGVNIPRDVVDAMHGVDAAVGLAEVPEALLAALRDAVGAETTRRETPDA